jgi:hypothetical protein
VKDALARVRRVPVRCSGVKHKMAFMPLIVSGDYRRSASRWGLSHSFLTAAPPRNTVTTPNKRDSSNLDTTNEVPQAIISK